MPLFIYPQLAYFVTSIPVIIDGFAYTVAAGDHHTCAVLLDGSVACWGLNNHGQLGTGDTTSILNPSAINLGIGAAHLCSKISKLSSCIGISKRTTHTLISLCAERNSAIQLVGRCRIRL